LYFCFQVIEAIANAIGGTDGCNVLDVDPGLSTNRTVFTFVGSPDAVVEGALNGARAAYQLINMTRHQGEYRSLNLFTTVLLLEIGVENIDIEALIAMCCSIKHT